LPVGVPTSQMARGVSVKYERTADCALGTDAAPGL
jgi:hypothetical protein